MILISFSRLARLLTLTRSIIIIFCFAGASLQLRAAAKWNPIDPTEWNQSKSAIDPEAGAEVILDETIIDGQSASSSFVTRHICVRIYGQRGIDQYSKVEIPFEKSTNIRKIEARTITPDGNSLALDPKDIYDREVLRAGNVRTKVKSFAPPGIVPNCIIEYRYTENRNDGVSFVVMTFSSASPARLVRYQVRMNGYIAESLACLSFGCPVQELKEGKGGYYHFEMRNLRARIEEPFAPPPINTQPVIVLYLAGRALGTPQQFWQKEAASAHQYFQQETASSRRVRNTLATIVQPEDDPEAKLHKIYDYCCTKIINRYRDNANLTSDQKKKIKPNENASDTLAQGIGTSYDINLAFAALVRATGADVRLVLCNNRSFMLYNAKLGTSFMLSDRVIAVRTGASWRFFDPGSTYLPFGQVSWYNSDTGGVLSSPKEAETVSIEGAPADASRRHRVGNLALDTDGTLEGNVVCTYTGLYAAEMRRELDDQTPTEREKSVRERLQATLKLAEVTQIVIENFDNVLADLKVSFHLRVPEYAERTGSRMFLQPAVFQKNLQPIFESAERTTTILFHYRNIEQDEITVQPPPGFTIEAGSGAGSLDMGDFGNYATSIELFKKSGKIRYQRTLTIKGLIVPQAGYQSLKTAYDQIHTKDNHVLTLKQDAAPAAAVSPPAAADQPAAAALSLTGGPHSRATPAEAATP